MRKMRKSRRDKSLCFMMPVDGGFDDVAREFGGAEQGGAYFGGGVAPDVAGGIERATHGGVYRLGRVGADLAGGFDRAFYSRNGHRADVSAGFTRCLDH